MHDTLKIDCALLYHEDTYFVFPTLSLVEIVPLTQELAFSLDAKQQAAVMHSMTWKNNILPLVTLDFSPFIVKSIYHEKIAIVNAILSSESQEPPYFAIYFNGTIGRKKLSAKTIQWEDEEHRRAVIIENNEQSKVTIVDLFQYSRKIEQLLGDCHGA